jgi:hypothetical protein
MARHPLLEHGFSFLSVMVLTLIKGGRRFFHRDSVDAFFSHHLDLGYPFNHGFLPYFGTSVHAFKHPFFLPAAWFQR